jgi:hypothetical protein
LTGDSPKPKGNGFGTTAVNIAAEPACMIFAQSDKKSDGASDAGSLCGVAPGLDCVFSQTAFPFIFVEV